MTVDGPNARELRSILAQLRHVYMLLKRGDGKPTKLLSKQIQRLESLERVVFADTEEQG